MTVIGSESLNMTFLKSFLAGLAASFVAVIVFPIAYGFAMILFSPRSPGRDVAVSWDLRSALASQGLLWCEVVCGPQATRMERSVPACSRER